ncbi:MAG: histone deacetylase family protein [Micrococcales bacterium]|nr:histone deacetylase family protein [Micrococcales bacterium]
MTIPVVWSDDCLLHVPGGEVWVGVRTPGTEAPERLPAIRDALAEAGHPFVPATAHGDDPILAVHDAALLEYLADAYPDWVAAGFPDDPGQDRVVGYLFPTPGLLSGLPLRTPTAAHARAGRFCYDTMTLVGPGTYTAARAAADAALTAVDLVSAGAPAAYAAGRPPGHHATREAFGGSCYLNNAAIAAQALRSTGHKRVAVIDIDAHHANGTQSIFYDRPDVMVASIHVDPGAGWFPHYLGFADEMGRGAGQGANLNLPLPEGAGDQGWLAAVGTAVEAMRRFDPGAQWCCHSAWTRPPTTPRARCGLLPMGTAAPRGR